MSRVWEYGRGWNETPAEPVAPTEPESPIKPIVEPEPADMPKALDAGVEHELIPAQWTMAVYGIPKEEASLRDRLRRVLKRHGLISIDSGGSVYLGVKKPDLDNTITKIVEQIKKDILEKKGKVYSTSDLVRLFDGAYDAATGAYFRDRIVRAALEDMQLVEESIAELEKAVAGDIVLKDPKTEKSRNLLTLGVSRIDGAKALLDGMEAVAQRFNGALPADSERIRIMLAKTRAWVDKVDSGFKRWADVEKAKAKKAAEAN